jgi:starvation-inducible DNA-binding protein
VTQSVLKNEITELTPKSFVDAEQRRKIADKLADTLADEYRIRLNVQGLHWNVEGPLFYSVHKLTEEQYEELADSIDAVAERIRALGLPAPQTFAEFEKRSAIDDLPEKVELKGRIERLVTDYESAARRAAETVKIAESCGDIKTADLLTDRIGVYDDNAWMLRATIATS